MPVEWAGVLKSFWQFRNSNEHNNTFSSEMFLHEKIGKKGKETVNLLDDHFGSDYTTNTFKDNSIIPEYNFSLNETNSLPNEKILNYTSPRTR